MDFTNMIEDILFMFGPGAGSGARVWDGTAGVAMLLLGVWLGFERWGRRVVETARTAATRKLPRVDENGVLVAAAPEPVVPKLTVTVAGLEPVPEGRNRGMEDTAPICLRVVPGHAASGWEGSEPVDLRPRDLGDLSRSRKMDIANAARREAASREAAAQEAEARSRELALEVARWEDALQECLAKVEIGTIPVSPSEIRRLEWCRGETRDRWEAAVREARTARDATEVARMFAEIAEAEAVEA